MFRNSNIDSHDNYSLLRSIYDPTYVRRIGFARSLSPVQVCLDGRMLDMRGTGVATYAATLARCLPGTGAEPMVLRQSLGSERVSRPRSRRWLAALDRSARKARRDASASEDGQGTHDLICADVFREAQVFFNLHRRLMPVSAAAPPPVMHWTYPVPLFLEGALNVYTIHDVIPLTHPSLTAISQRRHRALLTRVVERAHRIVAVTEAARSEIAVALDLADDRIVSLSQAIDIPLQSDPPLPEGLASGCYFFFCGLIDPRKNLIAMAQAHARSGTPLPLVIAGPDGRDAAEIRKVLREMPNVVLLPWLERPLLIALMRRARALVLVSLAEGFGLPIAEAMTLGTPVITSRLPATMEVAGDAAWPVDPHSLGDMAAAFTRLDQDQQLAGRLRTLGFARARHFGTDAYSLRLRDFYAVLAAEAARGTEETGDAAV